MNSYNRTRLTSVSVTNESSLQFCSSSFATFSILCKRSAFSFSKCARDSSTARNSSLAEFKTSKCKLSWAPACEGAVYSVSEASQLLQNKHYIISWRTICCELGRTVDLITNRENRCRNKICRLDQLGPIEVLQCPVFTGKSISLLPLPTYEMSSWIS